MDRDGAIQAVLLADATVSPLVGHRVWFSVLPQERAGVGWMPAVVVQGQDAEEAYAMGGPIGLARGQVQVDGWAEDRAKCESLRAGVRDALAAFGGTVGGVRVIVVGTLSQPPVWDPEAKLWRSVQFFDVWG